MTATIDRLRRELGELLERHERSRDLSEFSVYAKDPVGFVRDVLGGEPWSAQVEIAEAVENEPLVVVRSCNAAGKDWISAALALWWVYARRGLVLLTGPTERQVREIVMTEVRAAFARAESLPGELFERALRVDRDDRVGILAFTSTEASRLTGFHAPLVLAIVTEAQGVEGWTFEGLLACATGSEDRILAVGNPLLPSGRFYAVSKSPNWRSIKISAHDHPNVVEGRVVIPGGVTREFAERMAREYGVGSGIYCARVLGEFPEQAEDGLIARPWIDAAFERHGWAEIDEVVEPIAGLDPARFGPDSSVLVVRRGSVVTAIDSFRKLDTAQLVVKVSRALKEHGFSPCESTRDVRRPPWGRVVVDEVGLGAGVADRLREIGYRVTLFNGGRSARNPRRFANLRAQSFWHLREMLEVGTLALPADELLADELLALRWSPTSSGQVQIESKDEIRCRLGRSPDRADALAMAFHPPLLRPTVKVAVC